MKAGKVSRTAEIAAAVRAHHHLCVSPKIFEDPFALVLTDRISRGVIKNRLLRWLVFKVLLRPLHPVGAQIVARSRYTENRLKEALAAGIDQYVIIGAGFDSFALRHSDLQKKLRIFELDHPDTQSVKRRRISEIASGLPENVEFVSIDFEKETVADGLRRSTFRPDRPAFFSWLGTTVYLSHSATQKTLSAIAGIAATGSEIVFDYGVRGKAISNRDKRVVRKLMRFTARRGEPLIGLFKSEELAGILGRSGFDLVETISPDEQAKRYFLNRQDGLRPLAASCFARARVLPAEA